jgi:CheY-like chemotaxis protein
MTRLNQDHRRILLIDQNRTKQNLRATILRNYEIEVHTADNPREASALWTRYSYELVYRFTKTYTDYPVVRASNFFHR